MLIFYTFSYAPSLSTEAIVGKTLTDYFGKDISYHHLESGAPYLSGIDMNISLSHSNQALIFALSTLPIGIDIEKRVPRDFARLSRKMGFQNASDMQSFYNTWTEYEALLKADNDLATTHIQLCSDYTVAIASNDKIIQSIDITSII